MKKTPNQTLCGCAVCGTAIKLTQSTYLTVTFELMHKVCPVYAMPRLKRFGANQTNHVKNN
jgi:hypothetical protein